jgi:Fur family ferric uptake transcriptional regulator
MPERRPSAPAAGVDNGLTIVEPLCAVFRRTLKKVGLKYTPERARILDAVIRLGDLFQVEQLIAELAKPDPTGKNEKVSKATVYRTIKLLQEAGIIQQVLFDADQAHYQLAYGRRAAALLVRTDTGEVSLLDAPGIAALRDQACAARGLVAQGHRLVIYASRG